jgi:hypothetical protein
VPKGHTSNVVTRSAQCKHIECNVTFMATQPANRRPLAYCSDSCRIAEEQHRARQTYREKNRKTRKCSECGHPFIGRTNANKYCGNSCKRKSENARVRINARMRKYGMTRETAVRVDNHPFCDLCGTPFSISNWPVVDHDHKTGMVRGILHNTCNLAIGFLQDDAGRALSVVDYLSGTRSWTAGAIDLDDRSKGDVS